MGTQTSNAVIRELTGDYMPWRWALTLQHMESNTFYCVIEELKEAIPSRRRKWAPELKCWMFKDEPTVVAVVQLICSYGLKVSHIDEPFGSGNPATESAGVMGAADAYQVLWLREGAPPELVRAAQRTLAKRHHPDAGGDVATMQAINAAAELLTSEN